MAIKIFCNACQNFIKNVSGADARGLTGDEICEDCSDHIRNVFEKVDKTAKRGIVRIERARDDIKAKLEEALRSVIKGE